MNGTNEMFGLNLLLNESFDIVVAIISLFNYSLLVHITPTFLLFALFRLSPSYA